MKRIVAVLLIAVLCVTGAALAGSGRIVLYTCYVQAGWGDDVYLGYLDEEGRAYALSGGQSEMGFPYAMDAQIDYLEKSRAAELTGEIGYDDFEDIKSLIACVEDGPIVELGGACDAGTQWSAAIRYDDGAREIIPLGSSGDDVRENTDRNAQALYAALRTLFPGVPDYRGEYMISPKGFERIELTRFCGLESADFSKSSVEVSDLSCEEGPIPRDITEEQAANFLKALPKMTVTGKKNAFSVTGGTELWSVKDSQGNTMATFEFYKGALVRPDGMYYVADGD